MVELIFLKKNRKTYTGQPAFDEVHSLSYHFPARRNQGQKDLVALTLASGFPGSTSTVIPVNSSKTTP